MRLARDKGMGKFVLGWMDRWTDDGLMDGLKDETRQRVDKYSPNIMLSKLNNFM